MTWVRREPDVHVAGDTGGDIQVGEAYDARWTRPLDDGLTALVSRRLAEIDFLNSHERHDETDRASWTRTADDRRLAHLAASVDQLTRVAQVAADVDRAERTDADDDVDEVI